MDLSVIVEMLLVHLAETTMERNQARARVAELEAEVSNAASGDRGPESNPPS